MAPLLPGSCDIGLSDPTIYSLPHLPPSLASRVHYTKSRCQFCNLFLSLLSPAPRRHAPHCWGKPPRQHQLTQCFRSPVERKHCCLQQPLHHWLSHDLCPPTLQSSDVNIEASRRDGGGEERGVEFDAGSCLYPSQQEECASSTTRGRKRRSQEC